MNNKFQNSKENWLKGVTYSQVNHEPDKKNNATHIERQIKTMSKKYQVRDLYMKHTAKKCNLNLKLIILTTYY